MSATMESAKGSVRSLVPARMDRLPWTRFHWLVVVGLGVSWILDGLEIQIVSLRPASPAATLAHDAGAGRLRSAPIYLIGEVVGALFFGRLTDKLGRKQAVHPHAGDLPGRQRRSPVSRLRLLVPAGLPVHRRHRHRRRVHRHQLRDRRADPVARTAAASTSPSTAPTGAARRSAPAANLFLLDSSHVAESTWGWRIGFFIGPVLGLIIIFLRRTIPESPRWLMTHGREDEAERTVDDIEERVAGEGIELDAGRRRARRSRSTERPHARLRRASRTMLLRRRTRSARSSGFTMMVTQAFLYNAIFFSYALVLTNFYDVAEGRRRYYFFPFAIGNLLGPLLLGPLFDTIGRRKMIFGDLRRRPGVLLLVVGLAVRAPAC